MGRLDEQMRSQASGRRQMRELTKEEALRRLGSAVAPA